METRSLPETPRITETVRVSTPQDVADVLRAANEDNTPVILLGGETSVHTGNVVTQSFLGLDTRGISGVREYHPTDLTASFLAGTTLADVRDTLAEHGQELPVDLVAPETATIGGMVATGFAGPRRLGAGALKDLIIGADFVRGDGLVAKAGGMLVKNVSGFEIPRFLHGSWGSLAVITAINLKVIPKPKADVSFVHIEDSIEASLDGQVVLLRQHPGVIAVVTTRHRDGWAMMVRLMGRKASVDAQMEGFRNDLGAHTEVHEGDSLWEHHNARWATVDSSVRMVIGGRSAALRPLTMELAGRRDITDLSVSLGTGTLRIAFDPDAIPRDDIARHLGRFAVTWVVESAPAGWRGRDSVWGPSRPEQALAAAIKTQFDPADVLNRGRLFI
jgi:glycolate oxidase FAD binding subunit